MSDCKVNTRTGQRVKHLSKAGRRSRAANDGRQRGNCCEERRRTERRGDGLGELGGEHVLEVVRQHPAQCTQTCSQRSAERLHSANMQRAMHNTTRSKRRTWNRAAGHRGPNYRSDGRQACEQSHQQRRNTSSRNGACERRAPAHALGDGTGQCELQRRHQDLRDLGRCAQPIDRRKATGEERWKHGRQIDCSRARTRPNSRFSMRWTHSCTRQAQQ